MGNASFNNVTIKAQNCLIVGITGSIGIKLTTNYQKVYLFTDGANYF